MVIQIDLESDVPIYLQLMRAIKEGIATLELKPGDSLPSVRSMASDLGVNMHTVNKAYQLLKQEELIHIHRQKGVVVNPDPPGVDEPFLDQFDVELNELAVDALCRGMEEIEFMNRCKEAFQNLVRKRKDDSS